VRSLQPTASAPPALADWFLLVALTIMWGSAFALTKVAVAGLSPDLVVAIRLAVGASLLVVLWCSSRLPLPRNKRLWLFFFLIALFGNVIPFNLIAWGQVYIDSSLAGLLMAVMPLFTLLLAHFAIPGERLTWTRMTGFMVGLLGVAVLLGPDIQLDSTSNEPFLWATLAVLAGALCYAISTVLTRLRPASDVTTSAAATTGIGAILMLVTVHPTDSVAQIEQVSFGVLGAVVVLGVFSTALAAILYFRLIGRAGPAFVSQLNYLIPLWAVLLGALMFGERPATTDYLAMVIILGGIALSQRLPRDRLNGQRELAARQTNQ